jgi:hypothetical protein
MRSGAGCDTGCDTGVRHGGATRGCDTGVREPGRPHPEIAYPGFCPADRGNYPHACQSPSRAPVLATPGEANSGCGVNGNRVPRILHHISRRPGRRATQGAIQRPSGERRGSAQAPGRVPSLPVPRSSRSQPASRGGVAANCQTRPACAHFGSSPDRRGPKSLENVRPAAEPPDCLGTLAADRRTSWPSCDRRGQGGGDRRSPLARRG